jgi:hypothetical protein
MEEKMNAYRSSMGILKGKRPLGRLRHKLQNTIEIDPREIGWDSMD